MSITSAIESARTAVYLRVVAPDWYGDADFQKWLKHPTTASWTHPDHPVTPETCDAFITFCQGDGSDSPVNTPEGNPGIPEHIWKQIEAICDQHGFIEGVIHVSGVE